MIHEPNWFTLLKETIPNSPCRTILFALNVIRVWHLREQIRPTRILDLTGNLFSEMLITKSTGIEYAILCSSSDRIMEAKQQQQNASLIQIKTKTIYEHLKEFNREESKPFDCILDSFLSTDNVTFESQLQDIRDSLKSGGMYVFFSLDYDVLSSASQVFLIPGNKSFTRKIQNDGWFLKLSAHQNENKDKKEKGEEKEEEEKKENFHVKMGITEKKSFLSGVAIPGLEKKLLEYNLNLIQSKSYNVGNVLLFDKIYSFPINLIRNEQEWTTQDVDWNPSWLPSFLSLFKIITCQKI